MASKSESSFGARLLKAKNIATYIAGFTNYAPPRNEEPYKASTHCLQKSSPPPSKITTQQ